MQYKKTFFLMVFTVCMFSYCTKKDTLQLKREKPEKKFNGNNPLRGEIMHLYSDTVYTFDNTGVTVTNGRQLIIEPGTLIKLSGLSAGISIEPGGILIANGTRQNPIVFTSNNNTGSQKPGNWSGITIEGGAVNNTNTPSGSVINFSGSINYVRIEFAGLTLKSVGEKTLVENVQVSYAPGKAAFKIDGGNFNARNLLSYAAAADADFYFTNGYAGKMQNVFAYRHPYFATETSLLTGVYIENNEFGDKTARPQTSPVLSNITIMGPDKQYNALPIYKDTGIRNAALVTTSNARFRIRNSLFSGYAAGGWYIDDYNTARSLQLQQGAEYTFSILQANDEARAYYLKPGSYDTFTSVSFRNFILNPQFNNKCVQHFEELKITDPFNYRVPGLTPAEQSELLKGADYNGQFFSDPFFIKHQYKGAMGKENWMDGWVNFNPLATNYNQLN